MENTFPIQHLRKDIVNSLKTGNNLILRAPTGSGKSTQVPQFIRDEVIKPDQTVVILQPRRIAARLLAKYIASERNSALGEEIGYQIRLESQFSAKTRILFVTEGILLRRLISNDPLSDIGAIVFDEFHERHIETDLSLSLSLLLQARQRPDLKLVVMSATLNTNLVQQFMGDCRVLETEGKTFPVDIRYHKPKPYEPLWDVTAAQLEAALREIKEGSALVFMPGAYEINKTIEAIQKRTSLQYFEVCALHGSLSKDEQDRAVQSGNRKIIVATNVAETSLTIHHVRLVIDSGLARISRFDPKRSINTLFVEPISQSSANQRTGRAGRTAPGICIRLWSEFDHQTKPETDKPEIHRIDLSEIILGLYSAGFRMNEFPWLEKPEQKSIDHSLSLLHQLGALDPLENITPLGKEMARLSVHPRFSRMLLEAKEMDCMEAASIICALAQSQGIFLSNVPDEVRNERLHLFGNTQSDLLFELNGWLWAGKTQFNSKECGRVGINPGTARQTGQLAVLLLNQLHRKGDGLRHKLPSEQLSQDTEYNLRKCIFTGFSDFIAVRHKMNTALCQMMHGKSGQLHRESMVSDEKLMVPTELEEIKTPTGIQIVLRKVTAIEDAWIREFHLEGYTEKKYHQYHTELKRVVAFTEYCLNDLILNRSMSEATNPEEISQILLKAIKEGMIDFPAWNDEVEALVNRINFAAKHVPHYGIPSIDADSRDFLIQQAIYRCKSAKEVQQAKLMPVLKTWLTPGQWETLNYIAPETLQLPHRKRPTPLRYDEKGDVILSETVQALYDCPLPVTVAEGKVQVVFEILSPARRPVQITRDLDYFWKNSYFDVKKELKGRYPKHEWR